MSGVTYTLGGHEPGDLAQEIRRVKMLLDGSDKRPWGGVPVVSPRVARLSARVAALLQQAEPADTIEFTGRPNSRVRIPRPPRPSLLRQLAALA